MGIQAEISAEILLEQEGRELEILVDRPHEVARTF